MRGRSTLHSRRTGRVEREGADASPNHGQDRLEAAVGINGLELNTMVGADQAGLVTEPGNLRGPGPSVESSVRIRRWPRPTRYVPHNWTPGYDHAGERVPPQSRSYGSDSSSRCGTRRRPLGGLVGARRTPIGVRRDVKTVEQLVGGVDCLTCVIDLKGHVAELG